MQGRKPNDCEWFGKKFRIVQRGGAARADVEKRSFCRVDKTAEIFCGHGRLCKDTDVFRSEKRFRGFLNMPGLGFGVDDPGIAFRDAYLSCCAECI